MSDILSVLYQNDGENMKRAYPYQPHSNGI